MTVLAFTDCETVSLTPGPATIWELAVILRDLDTREEGDTEYLWQVRPDLTTASPISLAIGGYYERCGIRGCAPGAVTCRAAPPDVETGKLPRYADAGKLAASLAPMLSGAHVVAANPGFDAAHIAAFLRANGECEAWDYHLIDIGSLVRGRIAALGRTPPFPLKVADAARAVGIDPAAYDAHTALGDARMVRDVYDAVTGRQP